MSSALTVIVLGHAFFGSVPNSFPTAPPGIQVPNITVSLNQSTPTPDREGRRPDYTYVPGIGSHKVHRQAKTWDAARLICYEEGGDLAVINSKAEAIIIGQLVAISKPHIDSEYEGLAFIGFGDRKEEGHYETIHGQPLSEAGYEEWSKGEPNNGGNNTSLQDDCGSIQIGGLLNDANCARHYAFVCELLDFVAEGYIPGTDSLRPPVEITPTTDESRANLYSESTERTDISRDNYTYVPDIGAYKVHTQAAIWDDAKLICEKEGSHLAIINSDAESKELKRLFLESQPYQTGSFHSHYAIIGFRERLVGSGYVTVFGKPLEDAGFYEWAATEPNNLNGEEHCGSMDDSGLLNDVNCENQYSFICESPDHIGINEL